jgi:hypothetical protein
MCFKKRTDAKKYETAIEKKTVAKHTSKKMRLQKKPVQKEKAP